MFQYYLHGTISLFTLNKQTKFTIPEYDDGAFVVVYFLRVVVLLGRYVLRLRFCTPSIDATLGGKRFPLGSSKKLILLFLT